MGPKKKQRTDGAGSPGRIDVDGPEVEKSLSDLAREILQRSRSEAELITGMGVFLAELDLFVAEHKKLAAGAGGGGEDADDDEKSALRQDLETQSRLIGKLQEDLKAADGKVAALTETATNLRAALRTTNALEDDGSGPGKGGFGGYADAALRVAGDQVLAFLILAPTPANVSLKAGAAVRLMPN